MMTMMIMITMTKIKILTINARTVTSVPVFNADVRDISTVTGDNYINCIITAYKESHFRLLTARNTYV
jgi:hypothetical protein